MAQGCPCSLVNTVQLTTITYIRLHSPSLRHHKFRNQHGLSQCCSFNFSCPFLGHFSHLSFGNFWSACSKFDLNDFTFDFQFFQSLCSSIAHLMALVWWTDAVVLSIVYWFLSGIQNSSCPCMHQLSRILGNILGAKFIRRQLQMIFELKHFVVSIVYSNQN